MATKKTEETKNTTKDLKEGQIEIEGKVYDMLFNLNKFNYIEKKCDLNIMAIISTAPNGYIPLTLLTALFTEGIVAGADKKEKLFEKALEEHSYIGVINKISDALMSQMGFLFPKS